ncbi:hypothetical protein [Methanosarcina sp. DH2]|jgi:hypothetical protein|nr:hypothetical protein [Methanosarcina sp. DH2]
MNKAIDNKLVSKKIQREGRKIRIDPDNKYIDEVLMSKKLDMF